MQFDDSGWHGREKILVLSDALPARAAAPLRLERVDMSVCKHPAGVGRTRRPHCLLRDAQLSGSRPLNRQRATTDRDGIGIRNRDLMIRTALVAKDDSLFRHASATPATEPIPRLGDRFREPIHGRQSGGV